MGTTSKKRKKVNQTKSERAAIRRKQRELHDEVLASKDDIAKVSSNAADVLLDRENELFEKVASTREAGIDSDLLKNLSQFTSKQAYAIGQDSSKIDRKLFLSKLKQQRPAEDGIDWSSLGKDVCVFFASVPNVSFMLGPLSVPKKVRTVTKKVKQAVYEKQKPQQISHKEDAKIEKTEHEKFQNYLRDKLYDCCEQSDKQVTLKKKGGGEVKKGCVDMFPFLTNPSSFTQTVENIFEFSFIVKDGWAGIRLDDNKMPVLTAEEASASKAAGGADKQAIITFNMDDWNKFKDIHKMGSSGVLPHRKDKEYNEDVANHDSDYEEVSDDE